MEILRKGTERANETAFKPLSEVREAVGLDYFGASRATLSQQ